MSNEADGKQAPSASPRDAAAATRVVAIGASAGWFEALTELFEALPPGSGSAFVIVVHLDPRHESQMDKVLQRMTPMPVHEVADGVRVERNHVYVIPSNAHLTLRQGVLRLAEREPGKSDTHVIDRFFRSVAEDAGPEAVGVVLSGTLSDGTQGIRDIRAAGGFTYAQSLESSKHREMPWNAIASGSVDFVLPPAEIARELGKLGGGTPHEALAPVAGDGVEGLLKVLRNRTGVDFSQYKRSTVSRRIQRRMMAHRKATIEDYTDLVRKDPKEARLLYEEMLIHVTRFFREPQSLEFLRESVLPGLVKGRGSDQPLRVWVSGCATGEEAYTLAILMEECLQAEGVSVPVSVFATDISDKAIHVAREGFYPETIADDVSRERLLRHFERADGGYRVSKAVRGMCVFAVHNVVTDPPFSNIDLASCRNVLVYMEPELQRRVLHTLHYALKPSGYLVLGTSESPSRADDLFEAVDKERKVYLKKTSALNLLHGFQRERAAPWQPQASGPAPLRAGVWPERDLSSEADRVFLERASPAGVVVNRDLDVLHFRGETGSFLEQVAGPASLNLLRMARGNLGIELRQAVDQARSHGGVVRKEHVRVHGGRVATVEVIPLRAGARPEQFFLIMFWEEPARGRDAAAPRRAGWTRRLLGARDPAEGQSAQRLAEAERELADARAYLQRVIEEHEATVEELRSANEEAVSTNEELQSTNEELETAKEELQSTNEELNTLNDELQQRNLDVQKVNSDLLNVLNSVALPIVILGPDLRIRRFTPRSQHALNLLPTDIGRPFTDLQQPFMGDLRSQVLGVLESFVPRELEVQDRNGNYLVLTIHPYRTSDNRVDGVVLAFLPPDLAKRRSAGVDEAFAAAEALAGTIWDPLVVLDAELRIRAGNAPFFALLGVAQDAALHRRILDLHVGLAASPEFRKLLEGLQAERGPVRDREFTVARPGGEVVSLAVNAGALRRFGEEVLRVVAFREPGPAEGRR